MAVISRTTFRLMQLRNIHTPAVVAALALLAKLHLMLPKLIEAATFAGQSILRFRGGMDLQIQLKADQSPLTIADQTANDIIDKALKKLTPNIPIISEESTIPEYSVRKDWSQFWLVDPLDGTKEFISGGDDFTVNIALIENGVPILGVVYIPATDVLYYGSREGGSFKWDRKSEKEPKKITSTPVDLDQPLIVVESKSHKSSDMDHYLSSFKIKERIEIGSSIKFCLVAEGAAHIHPRFTATSEWDTAAGDAIYRYSGVSKSRQSPLVYNKEDLRNPHYIIGIS
ncbi:MAG: 3'(2'),5'-bisphosphate nucleotidase CysQ [Xanthomonadaceae bacterium]|nr:3'(2'),5'-bisphosphate nucleotidase CysQ [Xanthomonadaceae bacterium]